MLLDLLGTKNPKFYNYFLETADLYRSLIKSETILNKTGCLNEHTDTYFRPMSAFVQIDDDHMPFYQRGTFRLKFKYISKFIYFNRMFVL